MALDADLAFSTHSDPLDRQVGSPSGLGPRGWLRWLWARLTSMRTALVLLLLLGLAAIPGSIVPQRTSDAIAVSTFQRENPTLSTWYERFGLFDVYGTPWFSAIYLLLFISLVGCLVPRARQHWRMWRRSPSNPPRRLEQIPESVVLPLDSPQLDPAQPGGVDAGVELDAAEQYLRRDRWRVRRGDGWVAGEKGIWRENGNQIFHFALLLVLAAVGFGAVTGWQGNVVLTEGSGFSNTLTQYDTFTAGRFAGTDDLPPFNLQLQDFTVSFERDEAQRGEPRDFAATVSVTPEPGGATTTQTFGVNEPLTLDGAKVFLIGHGYAPTIRVRDSAGNVVFDDAVVFLPQDQNFTSTGVVKVPDTEPQLGMRGIFLPTASIDDERGPTSLFPAPDAPGLFLSAFTGDLGLDSGEPQNVYRLDDSQMEQIGLRGLGVGQRWQLPDDAGTVAFTGYQRWISVKVAHDPGGPFALLFVVVAIIGLSLSLFVRRRRIWVQQQSSRLVVGGISRGERATMAPEIQELARHLGAEPTHTQSSQEQRPEEGVSR